MFWNLTSKYFPFLMKLLFKTKNPIKNLISEMSANKIAFSISSTVTKVLYHWLETILASNKKIWIPLKVTKKEWKK